MNIIELAREAGLVLTSDMQDAYIRDGRYGKQLERFAHLVRAAALEESADVVDNADTPDCGGWSASGIADAIRALKDDK